MTWSRFARDDLVRIRAAIRELSPKGAARVGARVLELVRHLKLNPEMGKAGRMPGVRELVITKTELIALYVLDDERNVLILSVVSGRQDR